MFQQSTSMGRQYLSIPRIAFPGGEAHVATLGRNLREVRFARLIAYLAIQV